MEEEVVVEVASPELYFLCSQTEVAGVVVELKMENCF